MRIRIVTDGSEEQKNIYKIWHSIKRRSAKKEWDKFITFKKFLSWYKSQERVCFYCSVKEVDIKIFRLATKFSKRLTIDRKDNNKPYILRNLCLCCFLCNKTKGSFFSAAEMKKIGLEIIKPKIHRLIIDYRIKEIQDAELKRLEEETKQIIRDAAEYNKRRRQTDTLIEETNITV